MPDVLILFPIFLTGVFLASGILKLPDAAGSVAAFADLGLPQFLHRKFWAFFLAAGEILLGIALLFATAWLHRLTALAAVVLALAYLLVIWRTVRQHAAVNCHCFGALSSKPVSYRTVIRNAVLFVAALVTAIDTTAQNGLWHRLASLSSEHWWWLVAVLVTAILTWLITGGGRQIPSAAVLTKTDLPTLLQYPEARPEIPAELSVYSPALGQIALRQLVIDSRQTTVLLALSSTCPACVPLRARLDEWAAGLAPNARLLILTSSPQADISSGFARADTDIVFAPRETRLALGLTATPGALLLAADGTIASPPVRTAAEITVQVEALIDSLRHQA